MNTELSNNKVVRLDPPLSEKELEELLDLFYAELEQIQEEFGKPPKK